MAKRYAIWDKKTDIITPIFEILTPEQWMERYPVARLDHITVVCSAGEINGGFFGTLGQLETLYAGMGVDFSNCHTPEEKLDAIEAYEDGAKDKDVVRADERIAAALEYQNMMAE